MDGDIQSWQTNNRDECAKFLPYVGTRAHVCRGAPSVTSHITALESRYDIRYSADAPAEHRSHRVLTDGRTDTYGGRVEERRQ